MIPGAWLAARLEQAPVALREAVAQRAGPAAPGAVGGTPGDAGAWLRARAEALLAEALDGPPTHETALTLLAADALVTLACEWVGEHDPAALGALR